MKRFSSAIIIIMILSSLAIFTGCPKSAASKASGEMPAFAQEGMKLVYHVEYFGDEYDFIVDVNKLSKDIAFDWSMTSPVNSSGTAVLREKALSSATKLFNYFSDGDTLDFDEEYTSVWVSRAVYDALKKNDMVTIDAGDGDETLTFEDIEKMTVLIDGEDADLDCIYSSSDLFGWFWILDNRKFPIIVKMDIGWTITLTEIITK
ncbi:TPA: hypothetical protein DCW38_03960 [candidate division WOR-3 bacterium]|jgi:hypothetical protein|uniref:DUF3108 domain-containing protein n=1 Tax=candidate division WOR-3 bacterium TaxID=2052148 RepID=A0A350H9V0_UNCW3|nr:hypothetical protein [candidate division WOR-3 bacterium]